MNLEAQYWNRHWKGVEDATVCPPASWDVRPAELIGRTFADGRLLSPREGNLSTVDDL